jgi:hypothetical protein
MSNTPEDTGRKQDGTFLPGVSGNPNGRPKGARTKLAEDFCQALLDDFQSAGIAAIQIMRAEKPNEYARMIAGLLPKEFDGTVTSDLSPEMQRWLGIG